MSSLQDLKQTARMLARSPGFTVTTVLSLAVGIAFLALIFALIDGFLLRPLPFREPASLVHVWQTDSASGSDLLRVSVPNFEDWREQAGSFEDLGGYYYTSLTQTGFAQSALSQGGTSARSTTAAEGTARQLSATLMTPNLLSVLGVSPLLGRGFSEMDAAAGAPRVAVLSHHYWQRELAGQPSAVGSTLMLDGTPYQVVGVMPESFVFPFNSMDLYAPLGLDRFREQRGSNGPLLVVGRLRPGLAREQAQQELDTVMSRLAAAYPESNQFKGAHVVDLRSVLLFTYDIFRVVFPALLVATLFILLIVCANIANLMLARASARHREIAFRLTLGASRARVVRQLLTESVVLAFLGGALGVLLAATATRFVDAKLPGELYRAGALAVGTRGLLLAFGASLLCALAFGLVPALQSTGSKLAEMLKEGGRGASFGRRARRTRNVLVVAQVALAVLLVSGAFLMARTFYSLQGVDLGFEGDHLLTAEIVLPAGKYDDGPARNAFYADVLEAVTSSPGVVAAASAYPLQLNHEQLGGPVTIEGYEPAPGEVVTASTFWVSDEYFAAVGITPLRGRVFDSRDLPSGDPVIIVNRRLAERYWPGVEAIGGRILSDEKWRTIVGIVEDSVAFELNEETPSLLYYPQSQQPTRRRFLMVRTTGDPASSANAVRAAVAQVDPNQPVLNVRSMARVVWTWLGPWMMAIGGLGLLGFGALLLAAMGLYGVISYSVGRRTRELGIRAALGAARRDLQRMVVLGGLRLAIAGILIGGGAGLLLSRSLGSLIFGVPALDPVTWLATPAVLLVVAALAAYIPARRAARIPPVEALRHE